MLKTVSELDLRKVDEKKSRHIPPQNSPLKKKSTVWGKNRTGEYGEASISSSDIGHDTHHICYKICILEDRSRYIDEPQ